MTLSDNFSVERAVCGFKDKMVVIQGARVSTTLKLPSVFCLSRNKADFTQPACQTDNDCFLVRTTPNCSIQSSLSLHFKMNKRALCSEAFFVYTMLSNMYKFGVYRKVGTMSRSKGLRDSLSLILLGSCKISISKIRTLGERSYIFSSLSAIKTTRRYAGRKKDSFGQRSKKPCQQ